MFPFAGAGKFLQFEYFDFTSFGGRIENNIVIDEGLEIFLERFCTGLYDSCMSCKHLALDGRMSKRSDGPTYCEEDESPWHEMRRDEHECRSYD